MRLAPGRSRAASRSASSTPTAPTSTEDAAAQDRAAALPRGLPAGVRRPTSATSCSRPGRSSTTPPRSRAPSTSERSARRGFKVVLDYSYGADVVRDAERARPSSAPTCSAVNPYASTAGRASAFDRDAARRRASATSCGPRAPTSARCSTPTASTSRSSTTRATCSPTTRRCSRFVALVCRPPARRPRRAAGDGQPRGRAHRRQRTASRSRGRSCRRPR